MADVAPKWDWWAWVILLLVLLVIAFFEGSYRLQKRQGTQARTIPGALAGARETGSKQAEQTAALEIKRIYEDNKRECGLVFRNGNSRNLTSCRAQLEDIAFLVPHLRYSLNRYSRPADLVCTEHVPGYGTGKIPLFRWGPNMAGKDLHIVYQTGTQPIGYDILSDPILLHLNVWAKDLPTTYVVCRLSDRHGWGYQLTILESGLLQGQIALAAYQRSSLDTEGSQTQ